MSATAPAATRDVAGHAATQRRVGIACIVASALCFGAMAILARFAYASGVDTFTLLALRFGLATIGMALLAWHRRVALPRGADLAKVVAMGAAGYGGQAFTFFTALTLAPAGIVALLLYLHPALVALLAVLFLHERLTAVKLGALVVALAGTALTIGPALASGTQGSYPELAKGIGFALAAAGIYSVYIIAGTRLGARVPALALSTGVMASAAALFIAVVAARGAHWPGSATGWAAVAGIALVSTVLAITLFFAGLARIGPTRASTLSTVEPAFTVLLAALVLDERVAAVQVAGGGLILAAVLLLARGGPDSASEGTR